tara:strand:+ start:2257 stop:2916 length:660 start_codon:yes stop_codon:yes gene_type:complete
MSKEEKRKNNNYFILAIHSTNDYFGFGYRDLNITNAKDNFYIKKLDKDLSKNLITNLGQFLEQQQINKIERISISIGPANFNASRQIIVCARAISQQINCSLDQYSSYRLIAKRIAIKNKLVNINKPFWIFKKLKRRGFIAGKYFIQNNQNVDSELIIDEIISPKLYKEFSNKEYQFEAEFDIKNELQELLTLSLINHKNQIYNNWEKVFPLYPIEPVN